MSDETPISMLDKWKQFKEKIEALRFIMVIEEFSKSVWKVRDESKLRGAKISWAASDNVCMNFFSSVSIKKNFIWHIERRYDETNLFRGSYWQDSESSFRMVIRHPGKERVLFLFLKELHLVFKIAFYLKYQLGVKKALPKFVKKIDLAAVWKTQTYKAPFLDLIKRFVRKFERMTPEQFERARENFPELKSDRTNTEGVVEPTGDLDLIRETVANNNKQLTFQIFDFQVAGVLVIDRTLMDPKGVVPLRDIGGNQLENLIQQRLEAGEKLANAQSENDHNQNDSEDRQKKTLGGETYTDFKRQMTIERDQRKAERLKTMKRINSQISDRLIEPQTPKLNELDPEPARSEKESEKRLELKIYSDEEGEEISKVNKINSEMNNQIFGFNFGTEKKEPQISPISQSVGYRSEMGFNKKKQQRHTVGRINQSGKVTNRRRRNRTNSRAFMFETGTMQSSHNKLPNEDETPKIIDQIEEVTLTKVISEKAQSENLNNSKRPHKRSKIPFKFNKYRPKVEVLSDEEIPLPDLSKIREPPTTSLIKENNSQKPEKSFKRKISFGTSKFSIFEKEENNFRGRESKGHGERKNRGHSEIINRRGRKKKK